MRRAERVFWRNQNTSWRYRDNNDWDDDNWRGYPRYDSYVYYDDGRDSASYFLRSMVVSFLTNGSRPYYTSYRNYDYYEPGYNTAYSPSGYYYDNGAVYNGYDDDQYYDGYDPNYYENEIDVYFGGVEGDPIRRAFESGYYQGLLEGQHARRNRWGDRYYANPYPYDEEVVYVPYAADSGDCRRYLSEGYEMGYNDALIDRSEFEPGFGGTDLVSMLIGSVLSTRS